MKAKMTEFGGYMMPVQYTGIIEEHHHCRNSAGLFDVSHMGQVR
jgi:aminomethyltransferase